MIVWRFHIDAFWMVFPLSLVLQLWLLHTLNTPPSIVCLPCFIQMHFSHAGSIPLGSLACCTFYYTDEVSRLLTDTTKKIDTQRFQVAAVMGTSVPRLPIRDCAESCKTSVPRCAKVNTIDVMKSRGVNRSQSLNQVQILNDCLLPVTRRTCHEVLSTILRQKVSVLVFFTVVTVQKCAKNALSS